MSEGGNVLSTPGHLVSLAARGFARLSEARLKPLGFGVGHLPVLVALRDGEAGTQRDLARFARIEQPPMAQMLTRMERDGLIRRTPDPNDGRSQRVVLTEDALARLPEAIDVLFQGNRDALDGFTEADAEQFIGFLRRLLANLDCLGAVDVKQRQESTMQDPQPAKRRVKRTQRGSQASGKGTPGVDQDAAFRQSSELDRSEAELLG